jgi:hypothetical protein
MLHPLKPVDRQCEDDLLALVDWQRKTLTYACTHDQFRSNTFRTFMGDAFADWFEESRTNGHDKQEKAFNKFQQELTALVKCVPTQKQTVLDDFEHDLDFYFRLDDPDFMFAFSPDISEAHNKAQVCLNAFYEFLTWEIPGALTKSGHNFHRQDIVRSYLEQNPILLAVCPCCDNIWPEPTRTNNTSYTLEHFFHKEEHATICLHPYNLIPLCNACNSHRGNKEMLCPTGNADIAISQIFHPIERPAREYAQLEFRSRHLQPEKLFFVNSPKRIDDWQAAIEAYQAIYDIPGRWQTNWKQVQNTANSAIRYAVQGLQSGSGSITQEQFEHILNTIVKTFMPDKGEQDYGCYQYPAGRWLTWAKENYLCDLYKAHVVSRNVHASNC